MVTKSPKPKIKVEELTEKSTLEPDVAKTEAPKIASFSQLDSVKVEKIDEKSITTPEPEEDLPENPSTQTTQPVVPDISDNSSPQTEEKPSSVDVKEWLKDIRP